MKISITQFILLLLAMVMAACTFTPVSPGSPIGIDTPVPLPSAQPTDNDAPTSSPAGTLSPSTALLVTDTLRPTHTITPPPESASLPDLIIKLIYLEMAGRLTNCVEAYTPYEIRVLVENIGPASAGPFVVDLNNTQQQVDEGAAAGQIIKLYFAGTTPSGQYKVTVDSSNQVVEREEDNNTLSYLAPTPTPPPLCTATPIPTP